MADGGIVFALAIFIPMAISLLLALIMQGAPSFLAGQERYWVLAVITQGIMLGCSFGYAFAKKIDIFSACAMKTKIKVWQIAACVLLGFLTLCLVLPPQTWISNVLNNAGLAQNTAAGPSVTNGWLLALSFVLVAAVPAFSEELIFRGYICGGLTKTTKGIDWGMAAASAFLFAIMHQNPRQTIYPLILGFIMAVVYFATRSLWASVTIHFTNNALVLALSYFCPQFETFVVSNWAWIMPVALAAVAGIVVLFVKAAGQKEYAAQPPAEEGQLPLRKVERNKALPFYAAGAVCCVILWFMMLAS